MSIWAIVPVKPLKQAKSRLASVLSLHERETLSRRFLAHTLEVLGQVRDIHRTLVVSRDSAALGLARKWHAYTVTESGSPELNAALPRATNVAVSFGAHAVLVMPTDLPLLHPADVEKLLAASAQPECMTIAPDRLDAGTNALFVRPPNLVPYSFGPGSFARHVALANARGACLEIWRSPSFALDVDLPADLRMYQTLHQSERQAEH